MDLVREVERLKEEVRFLRSQIQAFANRPQSDPIIEGYAKTAIHPDGVPVNTDVWVQESGSFVNSNVDKKVASYGPDIAAGDWYAATAINGTYRAIAGGRDGFYAVLYDKLAIEITADESSDPLFGSPTCPPAILPLYRGEYSWIRVEPDTTNPDSGEWKPVEPSVFGVAGQCNGAWEVNRSNANVHVERMVVWMWRGEKLADCKSSDLLSSEVELYASSYDANATQYRYYFNLATPREDCANRYVISAHPLNDVQ